MKIARGILISLVLLAVGCSTAPKSTAGKASLANDARTALIGMQNADPSLSSQLQRSYAYAVFPSVGEGGFIVGGTYGRGVVYRGTDIIGYADLKAANVGFLAGGQTYDQIVLFRDRAALDRLINQGLSFTGSASATVLTAGVAGSVQFRNGVAVLVKPIGGLMGSVALGGQSINFVSSYAGAPQPMRSY